MAREPSPTRLHKIAVWASNNPLASGVILLALTTLVTLLIVGPLTGGNDRDATTIVTPQGTKIVQQPQSPPKTAVEEVARRTIWKTPPDTFSSADDLVGQQAEVLGGDVSAYTPKGLIEDAPLYAGHAIYIVGRVVGRQSRKSDYGIGEETHSR